MVQEDYSNNISEQKSLKSKKKKKKNKKKKVNMYPISKLFNTGNISEKFEYGMSDW